MAINYAVLERAGGIGKGPTRKTLTRLRKAAQRGHVAEVRAYVMARERGRCRCCRIRLAESLHEIKPKSLRGRVSRTNSIAVCGDGTRGCHGHLQRHEILVTGQDPAMAESTLYFEPRTDSAREWARLGARHGIESPVMRDTETD